MAPTASASAAMVSDRVGTAPQRQADPGEPASCQRGERPPRALCGGGGLRVRLDGLRGDRDLARLGLLGLRDPDLEHAMLERGLDGLGVDALGQRQRARERAERALHAVIAVLAGLVLGLALTR